MSMESHRVWFETTLAAGMAAHYPAVPICFENAPFRQPETEWIAAFLLDGPSYQIEIGVPSRDRHVGLVHIDVLAPLNTGTSRANALAEFVGNLLRQREVILNDGAQLRMRAPSYQRAGVQNGFYRIIVKVGYWRDEMPQ